MTEPDFHGWSVRGRSLHVGFLPGRKQPALYSVDGGRVLPLAYFTSTAMAREALRIIDDLVLAKPMIEGAGE